MGDGGGLYSRSNLVASLWRWSYRFECKEKLMSLGKHLDVSLAQAPRTFLSDLHELSASVSVVKYGKRQLVIVEKI
jgi:hypothetical protein